MTDFKQITGIVLMLMFVLMSTSIICVETGGEDAIPLKDAIDNGDVTVETTGKGSASGSIADMKITNNGDSPITVSLKPSGLEGMILVNPNAKEQDQVITRTPGVKMNNSSYTPVENVTIEPGENVTIVVIGYCINLALANPSDGVNLGLSSTSDKGDVTEIDPVVTALNEFPWPENFTGAQKLKLTQLAIWYSQAENDHETRDHYEGKGYTLTDEEVAVLKDILLASGMTQEEIDGHNGFTYSQGGNGNGDDDDDDDDNFLYEITEEQCAMLIVIFFVLWAILHMIRYGGARLASRPSMKEVPPASPPPATTTPVTTAQTTSGTQVTRPVDPVTGQPCATVNEGAVWKPAEPIKDPATGQPCGATVDGAVYKPPERPNDPATGQPCATVRDGAVWKPPEGPKDPATGQPCGATVDGAVYKPPERPNDPATGQPCATVKDGAVWKPPEPVKDPATGQPCGIAHDGSVYKPLERPKDPTGAPCATVHDGAVWKPPEGPKDPATGQPCGIAHNGAVWKK